MYAISLKFFNFFSHKERSKLLECPPYCHFLVPVLQHSHTGHPRREDLAPAVLSEYVLGDRHRALWKLLFILFAIPKKEHLRDDTQ